MKKLLVFILLTLTTTLAFAKQPTLNLYVWSAEIPASVIKQFEQKTGVRVNVAFYESNEIMYAKLRASKSPGYDIVLPSSYFVDRMRKQNMLEILDKSKLPNWKNLNPELLHLAYDPTNAVSVPHLWGVTGIFYNNAYYKQNSLKKWADLWNPAYENQVLLLDDTREVFSIALLTLGYSPNDKNPAHIKQAYLKLKELMANVKVFSGDTVVSTIIDEDANLGSAWNGDTYKASLENKRIQFVYPQDGFVIWVDNLVIPKTAPHKDTAYAFINFLLEAQIGKNIALKTHYPTANLAAQKLLPTAIQQNPIIYPKKNTLKHGTFQTDLDEDTLALYESYWEQLKIGL